MLRSLQHRFNVFETQSAAADDGEDTCLICLSNADDHEDRARGLDCGMCSARTLYCCDCKPELSRRAALAAGDAKYRALGWDKCPACREPLRASHEENVVRLEKLLETRTEGRHVVRVQYKLGLAYELGRGCVVDEARAAHFYGLAAEAGHVRAMFALAIAVDEGRGVARDEALAAAWFAAAAHRGAAKAQFSLGIRFAEGRGVDKDPARAAEWFSAAAAQGHAKAACNLGIMHAAGSGVAQDDTLAAFHYRQAARGGVARAMFDLACLYARGRGMAKDDVAALAWCTKAADLGDGTAMVNLAAIYAQGRGVAADGDAARKWLDARRRVVGAGATAALAKLIDEQAPPPPTPPSRSRLRAPAVKANATASATAAWLATLRLRGGLSVAGVASTLGSTGVQKILELGTIASLGASLRGTLDPAAITGLLLKAPSPPAPPPRGSSSARTPAAAAMRRAALQLGTCAPASSVFAFVREFASPAHVSLAALADMPNKAYVLLGLAKVAELRGDKGAAAAAVGKPSVRKILADPFNAGILGGLLLAVLGTPTSSLGFFGKAVASPPANTPVLFLLIGLKCEVTGAAPALSLALLLARHGFVALGAAGSSARF
ncbi:hypothetical protein JL722_5347 [Aureococcus anophagefferens]|nr:hypothetical protein JL722_5347 [Aureococcus anophagefferens]